MKTRNYTKEYYINTIKTYRHDIRQLKYRIQTCETVCKREKRKLDNTKVDHTELWIWRDKLNKNIKLKRELQKELKVYEKLFSERYNKTWRPSGVYVVEKEIGSTGTYIN